MRDELGIPQDAFVVGHVGRFTYAKNHNFLLDIFSGLLKEKSNARLLLIGEGELMGEIQEKVQGLGIKDSVIFTGVRKDVNKLYSVMDVFCLPSFYEGMPVVAWEAQANGLPCVFSDVVSRESEKSQNCYFVEKEQDKEKWIELLFNSKQRVENIVPNIQENINAMTNFYQWRVICEKD